MKTLFPMLFSNICTLFFFLNFNFSAQAQCPPDLTVSIAFEIENNVFGSSPIPFCTPIVLITTVKNTSNTVQTTDLSTEVRSFYEVVCLGDYATATDCSSAFTLRLCLNNVSIAANSEREFRMTVRYNTQSISPGVNNAVSNLGLFTNQCLDIVVMPRYNELTTKIIGVQGQTTTITSIPVPLGTSLGAPGPLVVRGNVILDLDYTVANDATNNGFIGMEDGASLTIPSGRTLTLRGAYVFGCISMWNSIVVEPGGTLITSNDPATNGRFTVIEDGTAAIEARPNSTVNVTRTVFRDNETGVFVAPSTTGAPRNIDFSSFFGCQFEGTGTLKQVGNFCDRINRHPHAGIDVSDLGSLLYLGFAYTASSPRFRNMSNGILASRTRLFVNQAKFENIKFDYASEGGCGICSDGPNSLLLAAGSPNSMDLDFNNCSIGIGVAQFGFNNLAQINSIRMDNTNDDIGIGVNMIANNFPQSYIYAMNIRSRIGVRSLWNRLNVGEIYNNEIEATYPDDPSVSGGIIANENSMSGNWNIYQNLINVQNAQTGIRFNSGNGAILTNNIVALAPFSPSDSKGLQSGGSSNFNVSCNSFELAGGGGTPAFYDRSSIFMVNGTGSTYSCNSTFGTQTGLNVIGDSRPFTLQGNAFRTHAYGLVLNNASFIGVQTNRGNKWNGDQNGNFGVRGAQHWDPNPVTVNQSRFKVSSPNAPLMPTFSPSGWFQVEGSTDFNCNNSNTCPNGNPAGLVGGGDEEESYYRSAISGTAMQTNYAEEMTWTAQRNAYGRLMDNPSHQNNRERNNFIARTRQTNTGKLYQVEKGIRDIKKIGDEFGDVLRSNTNAAKTLANEIAELAFKISETKGSQQAALMAKKKEKNAEMYRLSVQSAPHEANIERKRRQEIQKLLRDNNNITTRLQPEINEKETNRIYLETIAQGKIELNDEQKVMVRAIAYQCPQQGGNAVFAARSLYSLVESVNFDDLALCNARQEPIQGLKIKPVEGYKISPNPATDVLTVTQSTEEVESGEWLIFDMAGKLLISQKVNGNNSVNINIQSLSEGIYFVAFSVNGQKRFNRKLVKIKSN